MRPSLLVLALALVACKPSGNEAYAEALHLLGEAERGPCKVGFDKASNQATVDVAGIAECLAKKKDALVKLEEAEQLGLDTREVADLISKTSEEVRRLESMHRTVTRMENRLEFGK